MHLKNIFGDVEEWCPDLKDSVYLTSTSEEPYDPINIACALGLNARGIPADYEFFILEKYNHKKFLRAIKKNEDFWCTYDLHKYAQAQWFDEDWNK